MKITSIRPVGLMAEAAEMLRKHRAAEAAATEALAVGDGVRAADETETAMRALRRLGQIFAENRRSKDEWIAAARKEFVPSPREACAICGRFRDVAQAHHVVPLAAQYDRYFDRPDHEHVWLCPTHHAIVHLCLIERDTAAATGRALAGVILELNGDEYEAIMQLLGRADR